MAGGYLGWILAVDEDMLWRDRLRVQRRRLRDASDPFDMHEEQFINLFRISHDMARDLIEALRHRLQKERSNGISVEVQVLAAVRFYSVGCYQRAIGQDWSLALSQTSVSRAITAVTEAINIVLLRQWVKFPMTAVERQEARNKFRDARQPFFGAIGAIDCSHISILGPQLHEEGTVNHHGYHSLNVQVICDPDLHILNVNPRWGGSRHDAFIWSSSPARRVMEIWHNRGERHTWLLGDSGYPLEPWLMTPITHTQPETPEFRYTEAQCSARNPVERCFGVLKSVWRCLSKQRVLMYNPQKAGKIVNACAVLHNMRLHYNLPVIEEEDEVPPPQHVNAIDIVPQRGRFAEARRVRAAIIRQHFT